MMSKKILAVALCVLLAMVLCSCDMNGLLAEALQQIPSLGQENEGNGEFEGSVIVGQIVTNKDGEYVIIGENGSFVYDGSLNGDGIQIEISPGTVYDCIDAYACSDFVQTDKVTDYVRITVRDYGEIVICLRGGNAPETVKNFQMLVENGFYDGLVFHRVIQNFMIQGGGMDARGNQRQTQSIKGEFQSNGVENDLAHVRGVISMARTSVKDSATSQFFICDADNPHLDGDYAAFGYVAAGMEVVDKIAAVGTDSNDRPTTDVVIESMVFVELIKK